MGEEPAGAHAVPRSDVARRRGASLRRDVQQDLGTGARVLRRVVVPERDAAVRRHGGQPVAVEPRPGGSREDQRAE